MSEINCNACSELRATSPNFVQNGITTTECNSLAADTGLNPSLSPKHNDAEDLHDMNDCLIGRTAGDLEKYNVCDWQDFMALFIGNLYELLKGIICALGGIWTFIHNILTRIGLLEDRVTSLEERVGTLEDDISGLKSRMSTAEGKITTLENTVGGFNSRISSLENSYTTLSNTVAGHTTTINNLSNTVAGHTTTINNLSNTVAGHTTTINNLSSTVSGQASSISQNTTDIAALTNKLNNLIAALGGSSTSVPVMRRFRFTVPAEAFGPIWRADSGSIWDDVSEQWYAYNPNGIVEWFSGAGNNQEVGEMWIRIPVTEMETVTGVWTQTWVVPKNNTYDGKGKAYMQTVNVQEWYQDGDYIVINFDTYILAPTRTASGGTVTQNGGPYPVTVDFLVVGNKTFSPI